MKKTVLHCIAILMALCQVISCSDSPVVDEKVWDGKAVDTAWYTGAAAEATEYTIKTAAELAGLAELVNRAEEPVDFAGKTITLDADLDLNNQKWEPIGNADSDFTLENQHHHAFKGIFDGNGKTIKNLNVDSSEITDNYYASALFGWAREGSEFKNLNIDTVTLKGHHYLGAVVGNLDYGKITDCNVANATIINTHANEDACGDKTGAIAGTWQHSGDNVMKNSSAKNCTIQGSRDAGQLIGAALESCVDKESCSAENVTVSRVDEDTCTGANIREELIGRLFTK